MNPQPSRSRLAPIALCLALLPLALAGASGADEAAAVERSDTRLDKKISLARERAPLGEIAAELARQTGVRVSAAREVAAEPALVFVTQKPAREVMNHLAKLFNFRWTRSGADGKQSYTLSQDRKSREQEAELRARDWQKALENFAESIRRPIENPEEEEVIGAAPAEPGRRAMLQILDLVSPKQQEALTSGRTLTFQTYGGGPAPTLPPALARELLRLHREDLTAANERDIPVSAPKGLAETLAGLKGLAVSVWLDPRVDSQNVSFSLRAQCGARFTPGERSYLAPMALGGGGGHYRQPIPTAPPPAEAAAKWGADPILAAQRPFKMEPLRVPPVANPRTRTDRRLYEVLPEIARAYGVDIIADAYRDQRLPPQPPTVAEDLRLYDTLNRLVLPSSRWTKEGGFLKVRSHTWHFDRLSDIPDRTIADWAAHLRKNPTLTLDDAARVASTLRDEQLQHFGPRLEEAGVHLDRGVQGFYMDLAFRGGKEILRTYAALSPDQQLGLKGGARLPSRQTPPAAREWLGLAIEQAGRQGSNPGSPEPATPGLLSLRIERIERTVEPAEDNRIRYRLRNLDGGQNFDGNGVSERRHLPPGFERGGQITHGLTFRLECDGDQAAHFSMHLPWAYAEPAAKIEKPGDRR